MLAHKEDDDNELNEKHKLIALHFIVFWSAYYEIPLPKNIVYEIISHGINPFPTITTRYTFREKVVRLLAKFKQWFDFR
jgi:hypothetical protein